MKRITIYLKVLLLLLLYNLHKFHLNVKRKKNYRLLKICSLFDFTFTSRKQCLPKYKIYSVISKSHEIARDIRNRVSILVI